MHRLKFEYMEDVIIPYTLPETQTCYLPVGIVYNPKRQSDSYCWSFRKWKDYID